MCKESKPFKDFNSFILQEMPDATLREHIGSEVTYSFKHEQRSKFERLFKQIEINKERLAIGNYGLSDTTLEEVYILKLIDLIIKSFILISGFLVGN